jgi:hypothetical protein
MKKIINSIVNLFRSKKVDPKLNHINHLAFYKSKAAALEELKSKVWYEELPASEYGSLQDKWDMINWSRVSIETKNQIIELAKQDIAKNNI